jgi:hypothetical protein
MNDLRLGTKPEPRLGGSERILIKLGRIPDKVFDKI